MNIRKKSLGLDERLYQYLCSVSLRESEILQALREETATLPGARMQIAPEQGQFMALLIKLMGAKKTLEIGVFTGYSTLVVALALPPEGKIVACDIDQRYTKIAQKYWEKAGVNSQIDLRIAPALETLAQLLQEGERESFDFVFIDADKRNYLNYYEKALELVRSGGLILVDNVLWYGRVADPEQEDKATQAIREFNEKLLHDERVNISLIPVADGLFLAVKN